MSNVVVTDFWIGLFMMIIPTIVFGVLQVFLAGRKNKWIGLILPALSILVIIPMIISSVRIMTPIPAEESRYGDETLDDVKIYIGVMLDDEGQNKAFSDLIVKSKETGEKTYYPLEFDEKGNLIGGEEALKYKYNIERLTKSEEGFVGQSKTEDEMKKMYVKDNSKMYRDICLLNLAQLLPTVVFLVIYVIMRKRVKKQNAVKGIDKILIEDL